MNAATMVEQAGAFVVMGGGAGGGFLAVKWLIEWVAGRLDKREARIDAGTDKLIQALERQVEALSKRLEAVENSLADCQRKHAESEATVLRLQAIIDGKGEIAQRAQAIVAADRLAEVRGKGQ
jgi:hypothetical protein